LDQRTKAARVEPVRSETSTQLNYEHIGHSGQRRPQSLSLSDRQMVAEKEGIGGRVAQGSQGSVNTGHNDGIVAWRIGSVC